MPVINISDELYRKLEAMANGFDSPQNVIEKLLEKRESKESLRYPQEERCSDFSVDEDDKKKERRKTISIKEIKKIYPLAKRVFEEEIALKDTVDDIEFDTGMDEGSAEMYVQAFQKMMRGETYKMSINSEAVRYFFEKILEDYSRDALRKALQSVYGHIKRKRENGHGTCKAIEEICEEFSEHI